MESLVSLLPAAGCAALMLVCFRMMRHPEMHGETEAKDEVVALREEVASLRDELKRTRSVATRETPEPVPAG